MSRAESKRRLEAHARCHYQGRRYSRHPRRSHAVWRAKTGGLARTSVGVRDIAGTRGASRDRHCEETHLAKVTKQSRRLGSCGPRGRPVSVSEERGSPSAVGREAPMRSSRSGMLRSFIRDAMGPKGRLRAGPRRRGERPCALVVATPEEREADGVLPTTRAPTTMPPGLLRRLP